LNLTRRSTFLLPLLFTRAFAWAADLTTLPSKVFRFEDLKVDKEDHVAYRDILEGRTHTGDYLEVHETVLEPGAVPHPAHRHIGEELFMVSKGTLEVTIAGKSTRLGPGSAFFVASNDEHQIRNVGDTPAQYFAVTLGEKA
jgi:quercetin dioxygenase-like cupin family protein